MMKGFSTYWSYGASSKGGYLSLVDTGFEILVGGGMTIGFMRKEATVVLKTARPGAEITCGGLA